MIYRVLLVAVIVLVVLLTCSGGAYAGGFLPDVPTARFWTTWQGQGNPYCNENPQIAHWDITQPLYRNMVFDFGLVGVHESCLFEKQDRAEQNSWGIYLEMPLGRWNK